MRSKIILSLLALFMFFAVGAAIATLYITNTASELSRLVKLHQVENLRRALVISIQTVQSDLFTVHTPFGRKLNSIVDNVTNLEDSARVCTSCHHSPELSKRLAEIQELIQDYQVELSHYITASANKERIEKIELKAAAVGNKILRHTEEMSLTASSKLRELTSEAMAKIGDVKIILLITLISAFILGLIVSINLTKSITKPIKELVNATRVIASGSLGYKISYQDKTEFGELADNFNTMSTALKDGYQNLESINKELQKEIGERKRAERKIEEAYKMTHNILEKSPFGVYLVDSTGMVEYANQAMLEISGETYQQLVGSNVYELPPNIKIGLPERIKSVLNGDSFSMEAVEYTSLYGKKTTMRNYMGIPFGEGMKKALVFVEDITESTKLEEELRHVQKMDAIGTLTGGLAHEFNNIIMAIISAAELFLEETNEDDPLKTYPEIILESALRASNLTQGLLTYSRKQITRQEILSLNEIVNRFKRILSGIIAEDIELEINMSDEDIAVVADGNQIEQVLMNLVTNSRDAMFNGGKLTITLGLTQIDEEFIKAHGYGEIGKYALISVKDTGVGMDEQTREKIFEPFFTTKDVGKGTGLGLSMVYGIIRKHNGYIHVDSKAGKGTEFSIYIPAVEKEVKKPQPALRSSLRHGKETILIAEDDRHVRNTLKTSLIKSGYSVIEATDGDDAIRKCVENKDIIDLFLCDVVMPKKNGKEAYDEIIKIIPDIKVLFISGYTDKILYDKGLLQEGLNFISKPVLREDFLRIVREVLDS